jgi:hypothetical protein
MKLHSIKLLGTHVRLSDGRTGHVAGSTIDGLSVVVDGRMVIAAAQDVTPIPPPAAADPPPPHRTAQASIKTCHDETDIVVIPPGVSVMRNGQWQ